MTKEGTPAVLFRNSIDLNRFSNGVSRKIVQSNIDVIIRAAKQLSKIDPSRPPSYKTARLRSLIKQTKESLSTWEKESVDVMIRELEGLAGVQAGFVEDQIAQALPNGVLKTDLNPLGYSVQTVAVSPSFAKAVVTKDPSVLSLKSTGTFDLTAAQGAEVLLPNGETVQKAFRGLASRQATQFNQVVRTGLLSGETTESIVSQLIGNLQFGQGAKTNQQYLLAGKEVLKMASHQVRTIVRTSVNQVSNAASQQVYKANEDITEKYKYVSTLDSRTTALCASLDGKEFEYGKGPEPPQHFNCRSTTVAVIDYDALKKMGWDFDVPKEGRRAAAGGMVPANETYGKWLYGQRKAGTKFTPGARQIEALGKEKAKYFNRLANKYGADDAIKKFVREDGSEVSLFQLKKRYGKPESITVKKKTVVPKAKTASPSPVQNKYIKKLEKISDDFFEGDYELNKATFEVNKFSASQKIRNSKSLNVVNKAKTQLREAEEALKYLEKRKVAIKERWWKENLPLTPKSSPLKKLKKKEMVESLERYEKKLLSREKALNPKDPLYQQKLETIRDQQFDIEQMKKRTKAGLPSNDYENTTPLGYIYDRQGFNSRPRRVQTFKELQSSKEVLKGADGKNLILYRGVTDKEFALQFKGIGKDGVQHFPGSGIYGNGTYAASRNFHATGKEVIKQSKRARATAEAYSSSISGAFGEIQENLSLSQKKERVTAFGFKKDAKVIKWQKGSDVMEGTDRKWLEWQEMIHSKAEEATGLTFNSVGEAASALGIDAYQVPNAGGITGLNEDYWVILNRGALIMADEAGY